MQKVADEAVLLDLDSQSYFGLDSVGTLIWEAVAAGNTEMEIVERIISAFNVDAEDALRDLQTFLAQLAEDELISVD